MAQFFFLLLTLATSFMISMTSHAEQPAMFSIKSSSFADKQDIPARYSCDGRDVSPQMSWSTPPANTQTFALICHDPDAPSGTWYHWVVFNIPRDVTELAEGAAIPAGALSGNNSWGRAKYNGPCPPANSTHRYIFTLYALDTKLNLPQGADASALEKAMQGHILGKTNVMGVFGH